MKFRLPKLSDLLPFGGKKNKENPIDLAKDPSVDPISWWGVFLLGEEQSRFFKIGDIVLCVDRFNHEWRITIHKEGQKKPFNSFAAQGSNQISLKPILPDRSIIFELDLPFYVPPSETLSLYVSSPAWIRIEAGNPLILLNDIPTENLADTWSGKTTQEGELCYASKTHCSSNLDEFLQDLTRVITPVSIINRSKETLLIETLKVPLPFLSIYSDLQNSLWTEHLNFYHEYFHDPLAVAAVKGPPKPIKDLKLLNEPRHLAKPGLKNLFNPFVWK
jgi:hypothetical protein